jgi:hypothetical protein
MARYCFIIGVLVASAMKLSQSKAAPSRQQGRLADSGVTDQITNRRVGNRQDFFSQGGVDIYREVPIV